MSDYRGTLQGIVRESTRVGPRVVELVALRVRQPVPPGDGLDACDPTPAPDELVELPAMTRADADALARAFELGTDTVLGVGSCVVTIAAGRHVWTGEQPGPDEARPVGLVARLLDELDALGRELVGLNLKPPERAVVHAKERARETRAMLRRIAVGGE